jgi:hypothetical protein
VLGKRRVVDRLELDRYVECRNAEAKAALRDTTASEPLVGVSEDLAVPADKLPE